MRTIINYLRQCFCIHDWNIEVDFYKHTNAYGTHRQGEKVYMRCNKCGYNKNHWKY